MLRLTSTTDRPCFITLTLFADYPWVTVCVLFMDITRNRPAIWFLSFQFLVYVQSLQLFAYVHAQTGACNLPECQPIEGRVGWLKPRPETPSKEPGATCLTCPYRLIWRRSLARKVLWQIVEVSQTTVTCLRALVIATLMRLLSPRNPTAPSGLDRT